MICDICITEKTELQSLYGGAESGWTEWAIAHLNFAGIEKRTDTEKDNLLLFAGPEFSCFRHL
jgi:hypothetical protein